MGKFPAPNPVLAELQEEVGELAQPYLDKPQSEVRAEAIQVAAMAMRLALEGDDYLKPHREARGLD